MLSPSGSVIGQSPGCTDRIVKYMANSAAKNISSLDSHTMVPTLTMLGRVSEWALLPENVAVVTSASFHGRAGRTRRGARVFAQVGAGARGRGTAPGGYRGGVTGALP